MILRFADVSSFSPGAEEKTGEINEVREKDRANRKGHRKAKNESGGVRRIGTCFLISIILQIIFNIYLQMIKCR
ncbi:MAG: hypothetical protein CVV64_19825 [Candidatus Wallbacteria bacterium HGW-Wallbacteria-1]|jgi:hypothetical protein|uniref:Uncharacterized protein n=1 Tax=Candidatus Wallbacteria bacterium HGW-Wallbacteria-1 TaxID=2013854 RepID=A0A2N1PIN1_9BACT|nr:MAG: hypothetical protein CVV64_19825 [Candidatus Wallbacteria bacterium HGW-Wallbacteria-1]